MWDFIRKILLWIPLVSIFVETPEEHSRRKDLKNVLMLVFLVLLVAAAVVYGLLNLTYLICIDLGIHFAGAYMMFASAVLAAFSKAIAKRICPQRGRKRKKITRKIRIISVVICAGGLLLAILLG